MKWLSIPLILSTISLIRLECVPVNLFNEFSIIDESHYYPNEGVYMEPAGQYLSYAGVITIPYVYVLPNIQVIHESGCPGYGKVLSTYLNALDHIKTITYLGDKMRTVHPGIESINSDDRRKRSLFPIVSVLSGGLSIWNTIEIQGIKNKIIGMRQNMRYIDQTLQSVTTSHNKMVERVGEISIIVSDHSKIINKLYNITHCLHQDQVEFLEIVSKWLYIAPIEFINAYSGAISGSLTPSLLSATNLQQILFNHNEMDGTLYLIEPSIVYELGKVMVTDIQVNNIAYIKGIIQLPRIMAMAPLPMYNIYTVNILRNGVDYIYDLPSILVCPNIYTCWKPDYEKCTHKSTRLLCMYGANTYQEACITNLYNNNTNNCKYLVRKHTGPIAVQTGSGVLLGGSKDDHKIFKRIGGLDIPSNVIHKRDISTLITNSEGDWITVNDNVYNTKISGFSYNFTVYLTNSNRSDTLDLLHVKDEWTQLDQVVYKPLDLDDVAHSSSLIIFVIVVSIALLIGLAYLYHQLKITRSTLSKRCIPPHEFIGLR